MPKQKKKNSGGKAAKHPKSAKTIDPSQASKSVGSSSKGTVSKTLESHLSDSESTPPVEETPSPIAMVSVDDSATNRTPIPSCIPPELPKEIPIPTLYPPSPLRQSQSKGSERVMETVENPEDTLEHISVTSKMAQSLAPQQIQNVMVSPVPQVNTLNNNPLNCSNVVAIGGWRALFKPRIQPGLALTYVEPAIIDGRKVARPSAEVFKKGAQKWENTLVGQVLGFSSPISFVRRMVETDWKKFGPVKIYSAPHNMLLFKFSSEEACREVMEQNWFVKDNPLILRKWRPGLKLEGFKLDSVPIWVKLSDIPSDLWTDDGLSSIASLVGKPLQMDLLTFEGDKLHFAKVYIEVNLTGELPSEVEVILEDESSHFVKVEYLGKPVLCNYCQRVGHEEVDCRLKIGRRTNRDRSMNAITRGRSQHRKARNPSGGRNTRQVWQKKVSTTTEQHQNPHNVQQKEARVEPLAQQVPALLVPPNAHQKETRVELPTQAAHIEADGAMIIGNLVQTPSIQVQTEPNEQQLGETRKTRMKRLKEIARGKEIIVDSTPLSPLRLVPPELRGLEESSDDQIALGDTTCKINDVVFNRDDDTRTLGVGEPPTSNPIIF